MSDYLTFPPQNRLLSVLEECPRSALLYIKLWEMKDKGRIKFRKSDIRKKFYISHTVLKNHLYALEAAGMLDFSYIVTNDDGDANISVSVYV